LLTGSTGDIDCITVDEAGADHLAAPGPASDGNFWHITAINSLGDPASGYSVNLTLPHIRNPHALPVSWYKWWLWLGLL